MNPTRRSLLRLAFAPGGSPPSGHVLVQVFLRGGADGLSLVPPHADDGYYRARPTLAVPRPDDRGAAAEARALDLDGFFGLHPALAPLLPLYQAKDLAIVHAAGSDDETRSHFEAQDLMERGAAHGRDIGSGWLARHLRTLPGRRPPLSAVAIADVLPESLRGSPGASAVRSLDAFALRLPDAARRAFTGALDGLYRRAPGELGRSGVQLFQALEAMERLRAEDAAAPGGGEGGLAGSLRQVARLIRAGVGLEAACVDAGGWDTHYFQGTGSGGFASLARGLAAGIASFHRELGALKDRVTLVALSEFGRRVPENVSFGTDHGRGGVMFVLGGGLRGGRVVADWPGVGGSDLEGPGDLRVTRDYRDVLAELVSRRAGNARAEEIFPGHKPRFPGLAE